LVSHQQRKKENMNVAADSKEQARSCNTRNRGACHVANHAFQLLDVATETISAQLAQQVHDESKTPNSALAL